MEETQNIKNRISRMKFKVNSEKKIRIFECSYEEKKKKRMNSITISKK